MKNSLLEKPSIKPFDPYRIPEASRVRVVLLDQDNLRVARGSAVLPLSLGVGVFWPDCPMPPSAQLMSVKCFALPGGEQLQLTSITLRDEYPPSYDFRMTLR